MSSAPIEKTSIELHAKKGCGEGWPLRKCESSMVETFSLMANSSTPRMDNTNTVADIVFWRTPFVNPLTVMRVVHHFMVQSWPLSR